jgi:hypothetical protein
METVLDIDAGLCCWKFAQVNMIDTPTSVSVQK